MFFDNFNLFSQFTYGKGHIAQSGKDLFSSTPEDHRLVSLTKIFLGVVELVPLVGFLPALIDRTVHNWTFNNRIAQRELKLNEEIQSDSFKLQKVYFDTFDSKHIANKEFENQYFVPLDLILDNSSPDRQIISLIDDLEQFMNKGDLTDNDKIKIQDALVKLEAAKQIALRIALADSESPSIREEAKQALVNLIESQISALKDNESMIIPCGYCNGVVGYAIGVEYGHAILMEIKKNEDKTFEVQIFNAGVGLHNHSNDKPLQYHKLEPDKLGANFINGLLEFTYYENVSTENFYKADDVYKFFNKQFEVKPDKESGKSHSRQNTGSCPKKSVQLWLHEELERGIQDKKTKSLYNRFRIFRTKENVEFIQTKKSLSYRHPLGTKGSLLLMGLNSLKLNPVRAPFRFLAKSIDFFFTSGLQLTLSQKNLTNIKEKAAIIMNKRVEKFDFTIALTKGEENSSQITVTRVNNADDFKPNTGDTIALIPDGEQKIPELIKFVQEFGECVASINLSTIKKKNEITHDVLREIIKYCPNLVILDLCLCSGFKALPAEIGTLKKLKILDLRGISTREDLLPAEIGDLESLEELRMGELYLGGGIGNYLFKSLPAQIGQLKNLRVLELGTFRNLEEFPEELGDLENLRVLNLVFFPRLKALPASIGRLKRLQELRVHACSNLEAIPNEIGDCSALTILDSSCVKTLPESIKNLENLKELTLPSLWTMESLPQSLKDNSNLVVYALKRERGSVGLIKKVIHGVKPPEPDDIALEEA